VFLDTVGLIARWDGRDQWHQLADEAFQRIMAERAIAVTTEAILLECGNALARTTMRSAVVVLRESLIASDQLIVPAAEEVEAAWREYERQEAGGPGIVDLISFQVMGRLGITEAFSNDRHFQVAGFTTLF
jgi:predicted nucleic acid-binding protein